MTYYAISALHYFHKKWGEKEKEPEHGLFSSDKVLTQASAIKRRENKSSSIRYPVSEAILMIIGLIKVPLATGNYHLK